MSDGERSSGEGISEIIDQRSGACGSRSVVGAGSFLQVLETLASARVNIQSVAILVAREGAQSLVAFSSDDLGRAREVLRQGGFISEGAERLVSNRDLLAAAPAIPSETVGLLL